MGFQFFDQYSLLHFAAGVIAYFLGLGFWLWFVINIFFEWIENTPDGLILLNRLKFWPGGKKYSDSMINRTGDVFFCMLGWLTAKVLDMYGKKNQWNVISL